MQPVQPTQSKPTVLIVDDEPVVLRLASTVLADAGFQAVVAESAVEAFELYQRLGREVALILVDIVMPQGNGLEMANRIRALDADVKILVMSGYSDSQIEREARARFPFIRKPFLRGDLLNKISEVLKTGRAEQS